MWFHWHNTYNRDDGNPPFTAFYTHEDLVDEIEYVITRITKPWHIVGELSYETLP